MALFDDLTQRIETRARADAERMRRAMEAAWEQVPGVVVRREGDALFLSGRGLVSRWLSDARLRFAWRGSR